MRSLGRRLRGNFARQAGKIYGYQGVAIIAGLAGSVVAARSLGPEGKGTVDLFVLLATLIVQFGMFGAASGFLYQLTRQRQALAAVHGNALVVSIALGVVGVVMACTIPAVAADLVGDLEPRYGMLALLLTGVLVYLQTFSSLMIGVDRAPLLYGLRAIFASANTIIVVSMWLLGVLDVETMIGLLTVAWLMEVAVEFAVTRRLHRGFALSPTRQGLVDSLKYGLRTYPSSIANWVHYRIDQVVIAAFVGVNGVGIYALSVRWVEMLWLIGFGLLNAGLFRIASGPREDSHHFTWRLFKVTLAATATGGIALGLIASPAIRILYGEEFVGAVMPLILLIPGVVAWDCARILSNYIGYNLGRPLVPTSIAIAGAAMNVVGALFAVPRWGLNGAAVTSSITYSIVLIAMIGAFRRSA